MGVIQNLTDIENSFFCLNYGRVEKRVSLTLPTDNRHITTRLSRIVKVINADLREQHKIDAETLSMMTLSIHQINAKIERRNQKISGIGYKILRSILPTLLHSLLRIELADKIFSPEQHASEQYAYNAPNKSLQNEDLVAISQHNQQQVLDATEFVIHKEWKGILRSVNITAADIKKAGLEPTFQISLGSNQCYISKIFQAMEFTDVTPPVYQLAAIAYVKNGADKFVPRLVYLSGADNLWRVMPIKDGVRIGKGLEFAQDKPVKASTNVPFELGLALNHMRIKALNEQCPDTIIRLSQTNSHQLKTIYNMLPDNVLNYITDSHQCTLPTRNANDEFTATHQLETLDVLHNMNLKHYPDFNSVEKYCIPGTFSADVTVYRMYSLDKQYEYVFYEAQSHDQKNVWQEPESHPWLASVRKVNAPISTFLTSTTSCNLQGADISGAEYWSYVQDAQLTSATYEHNLRITIPNNLHAGTTVPTWDIRKNFKIIQLFESWKTRCQSPNPTT